MNEKDANDPWTLKERVGIVSPRYERLDGREPPRQGTTPVRTKTFDFVLLRLKIDILTTHLVCETACHQTRHRSDPSRQTKPINTKHSPPPPPPPPPLLLLLHHKNAMQKPFFVSD
jgi:hypothetical protein